MADGNSIGELLAKISGSVGAVAKDRQMSGGGMSYNFRGIDDVVNACHRAFAENGVSALPQLVSIDYVDILIGRNKNPGVSVRVVTDYVFTGPNGDQLTARVAGEGQDSADKGTAKAQSVAMRVCLLQALMLPTDDPDPDYDCEPQQAAPPEYVGLRNRAIELALAMEHDGPWLKAEFEAIGGEGPVSKSEDVAKLRELVDQLEGAAPND
ncbi:ERF family ssDNA binding protein [Gordonia phage Catfish]|uniref:ERF family ssDNA binding protein n=1 Tax=Gordonia phage Catfish TaxID=2301538 RepID=A0A385D0K5_9CAUD|nr:ERF family ssDNA binding protein [Gordonia phage Catfish]AXQ51882.1 ERF family ssDNA binding protein [Gordonia phage Catfish]